MGFKKKGVNPEEGKKAKLPRLEVIQQWQKEAEETLGRRLTQAEIIARHRGEDVAVVEKRLKDEAEIRNADDQEVLNWDKK